MKYCDKEKVKTNKKMKKKKEKKKKAHVKYLFPKMRSNWPFKKSHRFLSPTHWRISSGSSDLPERWVNHSKGDNERPLLDHLCFLYFEYFMIWQKSVRKLSYQLHVGKVNSLKRMWKTKCWYSFWFFIRYKKSRNQCIYLYIYIHIHSVFIPRKY